LIDGVDDFFFDDFLVVDFVGDDLLSIVVADSGVLPRLGPEDPVEVPSEVPRLGPEEFEVPGLPVFGPS